MPIVELLAGIFGSVLVAIPKTAAAVAPLKTGVVHKISIVCAQVGTTISGILSNIAGHPVAVATTAGA
eukprot:CAMPEP_0119269176 /NCGR_PEP_ID=MMETSP1329-20130426/6684_1 /TAXON_ID=114041 /ORGANISM="Genus nov. species nov., Strain RCC1024" /LENGTH=67 /DNA_ID=CAMNT_0007269169 /DNA_START=144 /DNA_END=347 /DNA_ORIENTATION=+